MGGRKEGDPLYSTLGCDGAAFPGGNLSSKGEFLLSLACPASLRHFYSQEQGRKTSRVPIMAAYLA